MCTNLWAYPQKDINKSTNNLHKSTIERQFFDECLIFKHFLHMNSFIYDFQLNYFSNHKIINPQLLPFVVPLFDKLIEKYPSPPSYARNVLIRSNVQFTLPHQSHAFEFLQFVIKYFSSVDFENLNMQKKNRKNKLSGDFNDDYGQDDQEDEEDEHENLFLKSPPMHKSLLNPVMHANIHLYDNQLLAFRLIWKYQNNKPGEICSIFVTNMKIIESVNSPTGSVTTNQNSSNSVISTQNSIQSTSILVSFLISRIHVSEFLQSNSHNTDKPNQMIGKNKKQQQTEFSIIDHAKTHLLELINQLSQVFIGSNIWDRLLHNSDASWTANEKNILFEASINRELKDLDPTLDKFSNLPIPPSTMLAYLEKKYPSRVRTCVSSDGFTEFVIIRNYLLIHVIFNDKQNTMSLRSCIRKPILPEQMSDLLNAEANFCSQFISYLCYILWQCMLIKSRPQYVK